MRNMFKASDKNMNSTALLFPRSIGYKMNVHKTYRRRLSSYVRSVYVLCPVSYFKTITKCDN